MTAKSPVAYGVPLLFVPLLMLGWMYGGIFILLAPIFGYLIITLIDLSSEEAGALEIFEVTWRYQHFEPSGVSF